MKTPEETPGGAPPRATGRDFAEALDDVIRDEEQKRRVRRDPEEMSRVPGWRSGPRAWLVLLAALALSLYLWFGSPSWLQPDPPSPPSPMLVEAGMRVEIHLQAQRLQAFAEREGRLPGTLDEVGAAGVDMGYERSGPRDFQLWMESGGIRVSYSSAESLDAFLGDAREIILGGR